MKKSRIGAKEEKRAASPSLLIDARIAALSGLALPAAAVLGWCLLHLRCAGYRSFGDWAWALVIVLLVFSFITGFSIGLFVFPAALFLAASAFLLDVSDS